MFCIPRADKSAKMKDMFSMFGMVERMQENELGTSYKNAEIAYQRCVSKQI